MALLTRILYLIALLLLCLTAKVRADDALQLHEQEIEAGLIYNFLKYIEWPSADAARTGTMTICLYGDDPFKGYLQPMQGRTVNQRRIDLRTVHDAASMASCDLLFVNAAEKDQWPQLEKSSGGMIEFGRTDDHIRVSLNLDAVSAAKLKVEDRLLKLVTVMQNPSGKGQ